MNDEPDGYHSYLLRVWRAQVRGQWQWHASLESPHTGERMTFATLNELALYLASQPVLAEDLCEAGPEPPLLMTDY